MGNVTAARLEKPALYDLIVIGCSAGGIEALKQILPALGPQFAFPLVIIQHRGADSSEILVQYFAQLCVLPVQEPDDKEPILAGHVYVAPANYHLLVDTDHCFHLSVDEPLHHSRPSLDVFMVSAAQVYKERVLGAVLSGANSDGAEGLAAIRRYGGMALVQNPETAEHPQMPRAALELTEPQSVLTINEIRDYLRDL